MNKFSRYIKSVFAFMLSTVITLCLTVTAAASEASKPPITIDVDLSAVLTVLLTFIAIFIFLVLLGVFIIRHMADIKNRTNRLAKLNSDDTAQLYEDLNNTKWRDESVDEANVPGEVQLEDEYKRPQGSSRVSDDDGYEDYGLEPGLTPMRELYGYDGYGERAYGDPRQVNNPNPYAGAPAYRQPNYYQPNPPAPTQIPVQPPVYPMYTQPYPTQPRIYRPDGSGVSVHMREDPVVNVQYTPGSQSEMNAAPAFDVMDIPSMTVRTMNVYPSGGRSYNGGYAESVVDMSEPKTYTFEFEPPEEPAAAVEAETILEAPILDSVVKPVSEPSKDEEIAIVTIEKRTPGAGDAEVSGTETDEGVLVRLGDDVTDGNLMRSLDDVLDDINEPTVTELEAPAAVTEAAELVFRAEDMSDVDSVDVDEIFDAVEGEARLLINGKYVQVKYQTSFMARFIQSKEQIQDYYSVIKNVITSYDGVTSEISWLCETFARDDHVCAKMNIKDGTLLLYLALDPERYRSSKYHYTYVYDKYAKYKNRKVSMMVKIKSDRALKYALELIMDMMEELNIARGEVRDIDYRHPYETTEQLIERGLIKIIAIDGAEPVEESSAESELSDEPVTVAEESDAVSTDAEEHAENHEHKQIIHARVEEVDLLVSDEDAVAAIDIVEDTEEAHDGKMCEVNIDSICEFFNDGDTVNLSALKACGLAPKNAGRVKILARGVMTKTLTVYADRFSLQAVKMIVLAGGHAEQYK